VSVLLSAAALASVGLTLLAPSTKARSEGMCSVCLSELVDGEEAQRSRVLGNVPNNLLLLLHIFYLFPG
jgi:hypothetical protein